jgi:cation diffusion facilitator family transporter
LILEKARQTFKVQRWITIVGVILLGIKFAAWYITASVAIFTDALESIVNVVAGCISLYSLYVAAKPRDAEHPYGHGKAEFLSAGVEGTLIIIAGIWIFYEAMMRLFNPVAVTQLDTGIGLIVISGVINFVAGTIAINTGKKNNSMAITATGKHLQSDAYSTAGLVLGLGVLYFTNISWIDSAIALLFGTIISVTGVRIVRRSIAGIMDEADDTLLHELVELLNANRSVAWIDMHNLRVIKYGSRLHVDCHMTVPWYYNINEAHLELDKLDVLIRKKFGDSIEMFVHTDGCLPFSCLICNMPHCAHRQAQQKETISWNLTNIFENKKHGLSSTLPVY